MSKRQENIRKRKAQVIKSAKQVFAKTGIQESKMTTIAKEAGIGVASLYRYFETKIDIALEVGIDYWETINIEADKMKETGYLGLKELMMIYTRNDEETINFFRFIEDLDNFIVREQVNNDKLIAYDECIKMLQSKFEKMIIEGQENGTINSELDPLLSYRMINHTLTALKQKQCIRGHVLSSDDEIILSEEMALLIEILLKYIETNQ